MRTAFGVLALGVLAFVGVQALAEVTENRADGAKHGTYSEVVFEVETRGHYDPDVAARGLFATCQQTIDRATVESFDPLGNDRFSVVVEPALGEHAQRRVVGCLEDFTIDRVLGNVVEIRDLSEEPPGS